MAPVVRYAAVSALVGYGAVQALGRRAGSTAQERRMRLPGDEMVARPQLRTDHAITIDAPPAAIWPWLTQMGWHLGGYYTPEWVDRLLFPQNWPSLHHLDPALMRDLAVGDTIPDGPPGTAWYVVAEVNAPHTLVLRSGTHLPPGWRDRFGATIDWTWSLRLTELSDRRTRLQSRVRGRTAPWWVTAIYLATIVPADYIMARGMLRGIKRRAESGPPPRLSGRTPRTAAAVDSSGRTADRLATRIDGEIVIAAPVEQVFDMVADERNEPQYNPRIVRAEKMSDGPVGRGSRFTAQPKGMGRKGVMTVEVVDYDRPGRLAMSIRSSYLDVVGTLTFAPIDGGTRMRWSWDMRLRGAMRVLAPLMRAIGPRWEYRNWAGLKILMERG